MPGCLGAPQALPGSPASQGPALAGGDVRTASWTKVEGLSAAPWAHRNRRWGEPGRAAGTAPLPTLSAQPPLPRHVAKASLTTWEIPGSFISSLWPHAALSTAWHGEGSVACGCGGWVPTVLLPNSQSWKWEKYPPLHLGAGPAKG